MANNGTHINVKYDSICNMPSSGPPEILHIYMIHVYSCIYDICMHGHVPCTWMSNVQWQYAVAKAMNISWVRSWRSKTQNAMEITHLNRWAMSHTYPIIPNTIPIASIHIHIHTIWTNLGQSWSFQPLPVLYIERFHKPLRPFKY